VSDPTPQTPLVSAAPEIAHVAGSALVNDPHTQIVNGLEQLVMLTRMTFAHWDSLMLDVGDFIRASGAGTAHVCWRSETGWVGPSWEWIGAQS